MNAQRTGIKAGKGWPGPLIVSCIAIAIGGWIFAAELLPIATTLFTPPPDDDANSALARALDRHTALAKTSMDRFTGRSLFTMPLPPPRPTPPPPPPAAPSPPPPPPPPPASPASYTGPKPTGMLGRLIFFGENMTIRIGDEKGGIKVIGVAPPSNVLIEHLGGSYSVPVWIPTDWSKLSTSPASGVSPITRTDQSEVVDTPFVAPAVPSPQLPPARKAATPPAPTAQSGIQVPSRANAPALDESSDEPNPDDPAARRESPRTSVAPSTPPAASIPIPAPAAAAPTPLIPDQISSLPHTEVLLAIARARGHNMPLDLTRRRGADFEQNWSFCGSDKQYCRAEFRQSSINRPVSYRLDQILEHSP